MHGYRPAPPPAGGGQQVRHHDVAQHLAASVPGFGNPAGLKFRAAVHATTAFVQPGGAPARGGAVNIASSVHGGPYVAPTYAAPVYAAPMTPANGVPAASVAATASVATAPAPYVALPSSAPPAYAQGFAAQPTAEDAVAQSRETAAPMDAPLDFTCPITQEIMKDPVICADGHSYERDAITRWLTGHSTSPKTNARLEHTTLIANHSLRGSIEQFLEERRKRGYGLAMPNPTAPLVRITM